MFSQTNLYTLLFSFSLKKFQEQLQSAGSDVTAQLQQNFEAQCSALKAEHQVHCRCFNFVLNSRGQFLNGFSRLRKKLRLQKKIAPTDKLALSYSWRLGMKLARRLKVGAYASFKKLPSGLVLQCKSIVF
jgi:hypothetical protein